MDRRQPMSSTPDDIVTTAAELVQMPVSVVAALFATHEPEEIDRLMTRSFGDNYDDLLLQSMVTLANSFSHALERHRRKRGLKPLKLRCMSCQIPK